MENGINIATAKKMDRSVETGLVKDDEWQLAYDYIQYTGRNLFLTGRAGTGKTTFLHSLKNSLPKRMVVVAPTGVAAINAGGVTIHSFFQLPFGPLVPSTLDDGETKPRRKGEDTGVNNKLRKDKINIIRSLDLLIIDEVSMVRADLLDAIDGVLRQYRRDKKPFGGVQLLMIGDLQQLSPVIKQSEWELLREYYDTGFFFSSRALQKSNYVTIELTKVFRQQDADFIEMLNKVREGIPDNATLEKLNLRYRADFVPDDKEGYITLTTHNQQSKELNDKKLGEIDNKEFIYRATIEGDFPEQVFPTDADLILKLGAQVMFVKNDPSPEKLFFNGKIGTITAIDEDTVEVRCKDDQETIVVTPLVWSNVRYTIDRESKEISEEIIGSFTQMPLKLAWAITIHKSQGLTFEKVIIDAQAAFAHGQVYVALSRCRSLDGLVLSSKINRPGIISDHSVKEFQERAISSQPGGDDLERDKKGYHDNQLMELFSFKELLSLIRRFKNSVTENSSVLTGDPVNEYGEMEKNTEEAIVKVADRFAVQLNTLLNNPESPENGLLLLERISAASNYFTAKISEIIVGPTSSPSYETDNKEVKRTLKEEAEKILQEAGIKLACLRACEQGFDVRRHLRAKSKAMIEPVKFTKEKREDDLSRPEGNDKKLVASLRQWRDSKADEANVAVYMVISVKAMEMIAKHKPITIKELLKIKGIGKKKAEKYGEEILSIIGKHTGEILGN